MAVKLSPLIQASGNRALTASPTVTVITSAEDHADTFTLQWTLISEDTNGWCSAATTEDVTGHWTDDGFGAPTGDLTMTVTVPACGTGTVRRYLLARWIADSSLSCVLSATPYLYRMIDGNAASPEAVTISGAGGMDFTTNFCQMTDSVTDVALLTSGEFAGRLGTPRVGNAIASPPGVATALMNVRPYAKTFVVELTGTGDAKCPHILNPALHPATATAPMLVKILPGDYRAYGYWEVPPYVDVVGSGWGTILHSLQLSGGQTLAGVRVKPIGAALSNGIMIAGNNTHVLDCYADGTDDIIYTAAGAALDGLWVRNLYGVTRNDGFIFNRDFTNAFFQSCYVYGTPGADASYVDCVHLGHLGDVTVSALFQGCYLHMNISNNSAAQQAAVLGTAHIGGTIVFQGCYLQAQRSGGTAANGHCVRMTKAGGTLLFQDCYFTAGANTTEFSLAAGTIIVNGGRHSADPTAGIITPAPQGAYISLIDGVAAPPNGMTGQAVIYVDVADGDLKVKYGDNTIKTIVVDT